MVAYLVKVRIVYSAYSRTAALQLLYGTITYYLFVSSVTLNNASDYRANGLLSDYIGWTNELTYYRTIGLTD